MSKKPPRCDSCGRRLRKTQHELMLSDFTTGQVVGRYHTRPGCQSAAARFIVAGAVLRGTVFHPKRCGDDMELCDGGLSEWRAA